MANPTSASKPRFWIARLVDGLPNWFESSLGGHGRRSIVWMVVPAILLSLPLIITPLSLEQQAILAVFLLGLGWLLVKLEMRYQDQQLSTRLHLLLVWLSAMVTFRYLYYRTFNTLNFDGWLNSTFSLLLYGAELYAIATLFLAYFQTLKLKERQSVDLSRIPTEQWPSVDIYIPTYNEDIEIVRKTVLAAMAVDYPAGQKEVYVLDDGRKYPERREKLYQMCQSLGCYMMIRDNNDHAKAGNINHALIRTGGDLVLILDCDHIPSRNILRETVGFFFDPQVSLVQTPHWFYNPDPFERNLLTQGQVPVGNELFYKVLQKGNDFWNASFFCGSAAVVRKSHLLEIGGIAVETVTEDCHTSLRLHSKGYQTVYYDKIMVAGLAPETFSAFVGQQVRWARGMAQILRLEWPLFNRKLSIPQRICYTSATTHFFFGFPRLMYAIAPLAFLLFGINSVRGLGLETLTYALPSILLALNANYIIHKGVRFSFWNEIFEYAMAFQDGLVTFMALLNPRLGSFNVTDKGVKVSQRSFDWASVWILLIIGSLSIVSLFTIPYWLITGLQQPDAVWINTVWVSVNVMLLISAVLVALEQPQLRQSHRLERKLQARLISGQTVLTGQTLDISETGARLVLQDWPNLPDRVDIELQGDTTARVNLEAQVVRVAPCSEQDVTVTLTFENLTQTQYDNLILVLYSDVDQWYSQFRTHSDKPLHSIRFLIASLVRAFRDPKPSLPTPVFKQVSEEVQVYSQGQFLTGTIYAINSRGLKVALQEDQNLVLHPEAFGQGAPVGLLVGSDSYPPERLVAQLEHIQRQEDVTHVEMSFPQVLDVRQGNRIQNLMHAL